MRKPFIIFSLRISLLVAWLIVPSGIIWSCGPSLATDESRFALFRQGLDSNSGLQPFNYSESLFNFTETDPEQLDHKRNCAEWVSFCGNDVKASDIYNIQYKTASDSFLLSYTSGKFAGFKNNTFIKWLTKKENHGSLAYMLLAKEAEGTQFDNNNDPWDTTMVNMDVRCGDIAAKASNALEQALPVFLKERYAFQAIKMYYYSRDRKNYSRLHKLYENYLLQSHSILSGWAMVYYAMSQNDADSRTTFLLRAFDKTEQKKEFCYLQISAVDLSSLEKSTRDTNTLLLINTLRGIKDKGRALNELKAVYHYNTASKYLPLLITREINKLENWLWSPEMLFFDENYRPEFEGNDSITVSFINALKEKDRQYLRELTAFIESMASDDKKQATFIQLALAHVYNMQHDVARATQALQKIGVLSNPSHETQRLIEEIITTAHAKNIRKAETQQQLAKFIQKLILLNPGFKKQIDKARDQIWEHEDQNEKKDNMDLSELYILLCRAFERSGDRVTAGLLYNRANITVNNYDGGNSDNGAGYINIAYFDRYALPRDIDSLLAFKHKKLKTSFEQLITPKKWGIDDQYRDLKGTILFRQKKYGEALSVFESMRPDFWAKHYEYKDYLPVTSVTHTGKMIPSERSVPAAYTSQGKLEIAKDFVNLFTQISVANDNAQKAALYYKMGNAYFNTSYNGKAWMMFSYGKSSNENYSSGPWNYKWSSFDFYPNNLKYTDNYYRCSDAITMYKKALALTTNKELAAKCLLSLSVCDKIRHDHIQSSKGGWANNEEAYFSGYLKKLKQGYRNTTAFKEAAIECPDVSNYLNKK